MSVGVWLAKDLQHLMTSENITKQKNKVLYTSKFYLEQPATIRNGWLLSQEWWQLTEQQWDDKV